MRQNEKQSDMQYVDVEAFNSRKIKCKCCCSELRAISISVENNEHIVRTICSYCGRADVSALTGQWELVGKVRRLKRERNILAEELAATTIWSKNKWIQIAAEKARESLL